jgi:hypothetical protein
MIDRVWYMWQVRHGSGGVPGDLMDLLTPFGKTTREVVDAQNMAEDRDSFADKFAILGHQRCIGSEGHCANSMSTPTA